MPSSDLFYQPLVFQGFSQMVGVESTRRGGVSPAPYHSLNLGKSTADDPAHVAENRRRLCAALGFGPGQLAWSKQVHGSAVRVVTEPGGAEGFDALICRVPGVLLAVSVADCTPILVYDARQQAVAAIHAGWRGTVGGIVAQTLQHMARHFGTEAADCYAYVGTCISAAHFEVGDEVAAHFDAAFKRFDPQRGKFCVDLKAANVAQLQHFGVAAARIECSPFCTVEHAEHYFSHRRENGTTGRMMAVIGVKN